MSLNSLSKSLLCIILCFVFLSCFSCSKQIKSAKTIQQDQRMQWWRDAKFGMFIHWGVYSIPAGEWNGTVYPGISEWIMSHASIPIEDYETLPPKFNPIKFNAEEWVTMAKNAGMQYLVITSKHHDGFAIYDSKVSDYDIVDSTPYGQDVLKALSEECEKQGIRFCTYYSILDWHHPSQEPRQVEIDEDEEDNFPIYGMNQMKSGRKEEYRQYMKAQLSEIISQYDPGVLWFDGGWVRWWNHEDGRDLQKYIRTLKPDIIHNNRIGIRESLNEDYGTPEQDIPPGGLDYDWETCMTMNDSWGYKRSDSNWKPTKVLIFNLIDIASKGGNFLLNVGPTDEGLIPEESIERLKEMGDWLKVNGEAIHGTKAWIKRKEGPKDISFIDSYEGDYEDFVEPEYTSEDILFTSKGNAVYAICLAWPKDKAVIKSLGTNELPNIKISGVSMLGSDEDLKWELSKDGLTIFPPKEKPCEYAFVFKVNLNK
ncbi:MAG: alpha-L-fucosidase [Planctomycetota bacterium]